MNKWVETSWHYFHMTGGWWEIQTKGVGVYSAGFRRIASFNVLFDNVIQSLPSFKKSDTPVLLEEIFQKHKKEKGNQ